MSFYQTQRILTAGIMVSSLCAFNMPCFASSFLDGAFNKLYAHKQTATVDTVPAAIAPRAYVPRATLRQDAQAPVPQARILTAENASTPPVPIAYTAIAPFPPSRGSQANIAGLIIQYNKSLTPQEVGQMSDAIHALSQAYSIDPKLLTSLVAVESSFRSTAISSSGAIGLGQLKPDTAQWLGVDNPYDPIQNLMGVAKYMRYLLDRYSGSVQHALAAYFQGQGTIDKQGIDAGAQYYISKVSRVFSQF